MTLHDFLRELKAVRAIANDTSRKGCRRLACKRFSETLIKHEPSDDIQTTLCTLTAALRGYVWLRQQCRHSDGEAADTVGHTLFFVCARVVLGVRFHQLTPDSPLKQAFRATVDTTYQQLCESRAATSHLFVVLQWLLVHGWRHPMLTAIMHGIDVDETQAISYLRSGEPRELLRLRVALLVAAQCDALALRLCAWCMRASRSMRRDAAMCRLHLMLLWRQDDARDAFHTECVRIRCCLAVRVLQDALAATPSVCQRVCPLARTSPEFLTMAQTFLIQNWMKPRKSCCSKRLLSIWAEAQQAYDNCDKAFLASIYQLVCIARTSQQLHELITELTERCGTRFRDFCADICLSELFNDRHLFDMARIYRHDDAEAARLADNLARICHIVALVFADHKQMLLSSLLTAFYLEPTDKLFFRIESVATGAGDISAEPVAPSGMNVELYTQLLDKVEMLRCLGLQLSRTWQQMRPVCLLQLTDAGYVYSSARGTFRKKPQRTGRGRQRKTSSKQETSAVVASVACKMPVEASDSKVTSVVQTPTTMTTTCLANNAKAGLALYVDDSGQLMISCDNMEPGKPAEVASQVKYNELNQALSTSVENNTGEQRGKPAAVQSSDSPPAGSIIQTIPMASVDESILRKISDCLQTGCPSRLPGGMQLIEASSSRPAKTRTKADIVQSLRRRAAHPRLPALSPGGSTVADQAEAALMSLGLADLDDVSDGRSSKGVPCLVSPGLATPGLAVSGLTTPGLATSGLVTSGLTASELATPGRTTPGLTTPGLVTPALAASGLTTSELTTSGLATSGLVTSGLALSGLAASGLSASGLSASGLAVSEVAASGLASSGLTTSVLATSGFATAELATPGLTVSGLTTSELVTLGLTTPLLVTPGFVMPGLSTPGFVPGLAVPELATPGLTPLGVVTSGLTTSGLATPGLIMPGLATPGLAVSGLAVPGLSASGLTAVLSTLPALSQSIPIQATPATPTQINVTQATTTCISFTQATSNQISPSHFTQSTPTVMSIIQATPSQLIVPQTTPTQNIAPQATPTGIAQATPSQIIIPQTVPTGNVLQATPTENVLQATLTENVLQATSTENVLQATPTKIVQATSAHGTPTQNIQATPTQIIVPQATPIQNVLPTIPSQITRLHVPVTQATPTITAATTTQVPSSPITNLLSTSPLIVSTANASTPYLSLLTPFPVTPTSTSPVLASISPVSQTLVPANLSVSDMGVPLLTANTSLAPDSIGSNIHISRLMALSEEIGSPASSGSSLRSIACTTTPTTSLRFGVVSTDCGTSTTSSVTYALSTSLCAASNTPGGNAAKTEDDSLLRFKCKFCSMRFAEMSLRRRHQEWVCSERVTSRSRFRSTEYECAICAAEFQTRIGLVRHATRIHAEDRLSAIGRHARLHVSPRRSASQENPPHPQQLSPKDNISAPSPDQNMATPSPDRNKSALLSDQSKSTASSPEFFEACSPERDADGNLVDAKLTGLPVIVLDLDESLINWHHKALDAVKEMSSDDTSDTSSDDEKLNLPCQVVLSRLTDSTLISQLGSAARLCDICAAVLHDTDGLVSHMKTAHPETDVAVLQKPTSTRPRVDQRASIKSSTDTDADSPPTLKGRRITYRGVAMIQQTALSIASCQHCKPTSDCSSCASQQGPYGCQHCGRWFPWKQACRLHILASCVPSARVCEKCGMLVASQHRRRHKCRPAVSLNSRHMRCVVCGSTFATKSAFTLHLVRRHGCQGSAPSTQLKFPRLKNATNRMPKTTTFALPLPPPPMDTIVNECADVTSPAAPEHQLNTSDTWWASDENASCGEEGITSRYQCRYCGCPYSELKQLLCHLVSSHPQQESHAAKVDDHDGHTIDKQRNIELESIAGSDGSSVVISESASRLSSDAQSTRHYSEQSTASTSGVVTQGVATSLSSDSSERQSVLKVYSSNTAESEADESLSVATCTDLDNHLQGNVDDEPEAPSDNDRDLAYTTQFEEDEERMSGNPLSLNSVDAEKFRSHFDNRMFIELDTGESDNLQSCVQDAMTSVQCIDAVDNNVDDEGEVNLDYVITKSDVDFCKEDTADTPCSVTLDSNLSENEASSDFSAKLLPTETMIDDFLTGSSVENEQTALDSALSLPLLTTSAAEGEPFTTARDKDLLSLPPKALSLPFTTSDADELLITACDGEEFTSPAMNTLSFSTLDYQDESVSKFSTKHHAIEQLPIPLLSTSPSACMSTNTDTEMLSKGMLSAEPVSDESSTAKSNDDKVPYMPNNVGESLNDVHNEELSIKTDVVEVVPSLPSNAAELLSPFNIVDLQQHSTTDINDLSSSSSSCTGNSSISKSVDAKVSLINPDIEISGSYITEETVLANDVVPSVVSDAIVTNSTLDTNFTVLASEAELTISTSGMTGLAISTDGTDLSVSSTDLSEKPTLCSEITILESKPSLVPASGEVELSFPALESEELATSLPDLSEVASDTANEMSELPLTALETPVVTPCALYTEHSPLRTTQLPILTPSLADSPVCSRNIISMPILSPKEALLPLSTSNMKQLSWSKDLADVEPLPSRTLKVREEMPFANWRKVEASSVSIASIELQFTTANSEEIPLQVENVSFQTAIATTPSIAEIMSFYKEDVKELPNPKIQSCEPNKMAEEIGPMVPSLTDISKQLGNSIMPETRESQETSEVERNHEVIPYTCPPDVEDSSLIQSNLPLVVEELKLLRNDVDIPDVSKSDTMNVQATSHDLCSMPVLQSYVIESECEDGDTTLPAQSVSAVTSAEFSPIPVSLTHQANHTVPARRFVCEICMPKCTYLQECALRLHMKLVHGVKEKSDSSISQHVCPICMKRFNEDFALECHMKWLHGIKNFGLKQTSVCAKVEEVHGNKQHFDANDQHATPPIAIDESTRKHTSQCKHNSARQKETHACKKPVKCLLEQDVKQRIKSSKILAENDGSGSKDVKDVYDPQHSDNIRKSFTSENKVEHEDTKRKLNGSCAKAQTAQSDISRVDNAIVTSKLASEKPTFSHSNSEDESSGQVDSTSNLVALTADGICNDDNCSDSIEQENCAGKSAYDAKVLDSAEENVSTVCKAATRRRTRSCNNTDHPPLPSSVKAYRHTSEPPSETCKKRPPTILKCGGKSVKSGSGSLRSSLQLNNCSNMNIDTNSSSCVTRLRARSSNKIHQISSAIADKVPKQVASESPAEDKVHQHLSDVKNKAGKQKLLVVSRYSNVNKTKKGKLPQTNKHLKSSVSSMRQPITRRKQTLAWKCAICRQSFASMNVWQAHVTAAHQAPTVNASSTANRSKHVRIRSHSVASKRAVHKSQNRFNKMKVKDQCRVVRNKSGIVKSNKSIVDSARDVASVSNPRNSVADNTSGMPFLSSIAHVYPEKSRKMPLNATKSLTSSLASGDTKTQVAAAATLQSVKSSSKIVAANTPNCSVNQVSSSLTLTRNVKNIQQQAELAHNDAAVVALKSSRSTEADLIRKDNAENCGPIGDAKCLPAQQKSALPGKHSETKKHNEVQLNDAPACTKTIIIYRKTNTDKRAEKDTATSIIHHAPASDCDLSEKQPLAELAVNEPAHAGPEVTSAKTFETLPPDTSQTIPSLPCKKVVGEPTRKKESISTRSVVSDSVARQKRTMNTLPANKVSILKLVQEIGRQTVQKDPVKQTHITDTQPTSPKLRSQKEQQQRKQEKQQVKSSHRRQQQQRKTQLHKKQQESPKRQKLNKQQQQQKDHRHKTKCGKDQLRKRNSRHASNSTTTHTADPCSPVTVRHKMLHTMRSGRVYETEAIVKVNNDSQTDVVTPGSKRRKQVYVMACRTSKRRRTATSPF